MFLQQVSIPKILVQGRQMWKKVEKKNVVGYSKHLKIPSRCSIKNGSMIQNWNGEKSHDRYPVVFLLEALSDYQD